jgi:hypothetical protein
MEPTDADVGVFLDTVAGEVRRRDATTLVDLLQRITGQAPRMWGSSIVGFGRYHYRYASGRGGEGPAAGFSPRKAATTVYLADGVGAHADHLEQLGPHTTGVGCLYIKDLADVDLTVLETVLAASYRAVVGDGSVRFSSDDAGPGSSG